MQDDKTQSLATDLSIMAVRLSRWLRAADDAPALSGPEASAMAVIVHSGGIIPSALADLEQVKRPTITRIVNGLAARGLVRREAHPDDKRALIIVATEKGLVLWQAGQLRRVAPLVTRISKLNAAEREQLENVMPLLNKITAPPES
ncbi:MarR family transcriptional regulator [Altererythrobacter sp.]|nr:MarR family transcriptional regulator [Altererythrobacter sp.]